MINPSHEELKTHKNNSMMGWFSAIRELPGIMFRRKLFDWNILKFFRRVPVVQMILMRIWIIFYIIQAEINQSKNNS